MTTSLSLNRHSKIVFFTGAGMSAESGVPTYRGKGGIWSQYNYQEYACQQAFEANPAKVWEFHNTRRRFVAQCQPNAGHQLIAQLESDLPHVTVVTQNIDGLHQRAGTQKIFELHGSLWRIRCDACRVVEENHDLPLDPIQHHCGAYWRPDIVWFGDMLSSEVMQGALDAIAHCDLLVSIGTSGVVYPAAQFPLLAKQQGATLVEINPQETPLSSQYDLCLRGPASEMLPQLLRQISFS